MRLRVILIAIAIACFALQLWAYDKSWLTAQDPNHCLAWGFGRCESIMASGYAAIVPGQNVNFEGVTARLVPLVMWLGLLFAVLRPSRSVLAAATVFAVLLSIPAFRSRPEAGPTAATMTSRAAARLCSSC